MLKISSDRPSCWTVSINLHSYIWLFWFPAQYFQLHLFALVWLLKPLFAQQCVDFVFRWAYFNCSLDKPRSKSKVQSNENAGVTVLASYWDASLSTVFPCLRTLNLRNVIVFLFARRLFGDFFWRFAAFQCLAKRRKVTATRSRFQYACIVRLKTTTIKFFKSKEHLNEYFRCCIHHTNPILYRRLAFELLPKNVLENSLTTKQTRMLGNCVSKNCFNF